MDLKGKKKQCQIQRDEDGVVVEKRKDIRCFGHALGRSGESRPVRGSCSN